MPISIKMHSIAVTHTCVCNDEIETEACGSKCSFNIIKSSHIGRGHIPAEQYPNGQGKRDIQVTGKKVRA